MLKKEDEIKVSVVEAKGENLMQQLEEEKEQPPNQVSNHDIE